jgi:hypothetical protein
MHCPATKMRRYFNKDIYIGESASPKRRGVFLLNSKNFYEIFAFFVYPVNFL